MTRIAFRFFFAYCCLYMFYTWLRFQTIPGLKQLHGFIWPIWRGVVMFFNDHLLHIGGTLIEPNSSTDTSFSWAAQFTMLIVAVLIAGAWTIIDRKRDNHQTEEYWLRVAVRYFITYFALYYGIIKLFAVQMPFPSLSQLSTPLGDLSLTRLSWMYMGASPAYQVFSGVLETMAGIFLLNRRTVTLGAMLSAAVFGNVVAMNFAYDIPVKIMSAHFFLLSIYLLCFEWRRLLDFFLNKPTTPADLYRPSFESKPAKYGRIAAQGAFLYVSVVMVLILSINTYRSQHLVVDTKPIEQGIYDVKYFSLNGDSVLTGRDSLRWRDLALYGVTGSVKASDTSFVQRYERSYFFFDVDPQAGMLNIRRNYGDEKKLMALRYEIPDAETLKLTNESLVIVLKKSKKKFELAGPNQFHWLQESSK
ncbi:MAG TPA: hypothetical protein VF473_04280 [Cyclobacteriaceae bacterium]